MPFPIRCPGCEATLTVAENLVGRTIKCNKCGEMIAVNAPAAARAAAPARPARAAAVLDDDPRPARPARHRADDDDEDLAPRPRKKAAAPVPAAAGKSKAPLIIGLVVGLLVLAGGAAGAYFA